MRRDRQDNEYGSRNHQKYQDHWEDSHEDLDSAGLRLPVLRRCHRGWTITRGRIVREIRVPSWDHPVAIMSLLVA
jgi:hypothetical protein